MPTIAREAQLARLSEKYILKRITDLSFGRDVNLEGIGINEASKRLATKDYIVNSLNKQIQISKKRVKHCERYLADYNYELGRRYAMGTI